MARVRIVLEAHERMRGIILRPAPLARSKQLCHFRRREQVMQHKHGRVMRHLLHTKLALALALSRSAFFNLAVGFLKMRLKKRSLWLRLVLLASPIGYSAVKLAMSCGFSFWCHSGLSSKRSMYASTASKLCGRLPPPLPALRPSAPTHAHC